MCRKSQSLKYLVRLGNCPSRTKEYYVLHARKHQTQSNLQIIWIYDEYWMKNDHIILIS